MCFIAPEDGAVDLHLVMLARAILRLADRADRRLAEHGRRHAMMVHLDGIVVEQRLGEGAALGNRNGREIEPVRHVADGIDVRHGRLLPFVDRDGAALVEMHADAAQTQAFGVGHAAGRVHDHVGFEEIALVRHQAIAVADFVDTLAAGRVLDLDALLLHLGRQMGADILVEAAQDLVAADKLRDLHARRVEDAGELDSDITPADNDDTLGQVLRARGRRPRR